MHAKDLDVFVIPVTGASNGMGLSMTEYLLAKGDVVVAAVRRPESMKGHQVEYGADKLLVVKVDVKNQEDIDAGFKKAEETFGRIDVVHNNAGYSAVGEVEAMPMLDGKEMFEVRVSTMVFRFFSNNLPFRLTSSERLECLSLLSSSSVRSTSPSVDA